MAKSNFMGKQLKKFAVTESTLTTDEVNLLDGATQASSIADLTVTYTTGDPGTTPNSAIVVANGAAISDAEIVAAIDELAAKVNAILAALDTFGVTA